MAILDEILSFFYLKVFVLLDKDSPETLYPTIILTILFFVILRFLIKAYNEDDEKMHKTSIIALFTFAITATSIWFIMDKSITDIKNECKQKELKKPSESSENVEKLRQMLQERKLEKAREAQMDNQ